MRRVLQIIAGVSMAAVTTGCGGTVNYNPATTLDTTPPTVNLLITRYGQPQLEVQQRVVPSPNTRGDFGIPIPPRKFDFSILATAKDAESGIRSLKLNMTRTVCYTASSGSVAQAYFGTVVRKEASYTDAQHAPTQPSVGDTGIIDNSPFGTHPANLTDDNLLVWKNANQDRNVGIGVSTKWNMETTNFAGATTYSDVIFISAGDTSCVTNP
jgi:hypothetical protein